MFVPFVGFARLLVKLFPLRPNPKLDALVLSDLRRKYRKWDLICIAAFFVAWPACIYALHEPLIWYTAANAPPLADAVYTLVPVPTFFYAPASMLGAVLACLLVFVLYSVALRQRAAEYRYASNRPGGFNASRMYLVVGIVFGLGWLAVAYFAARSSFRLTESELVFRRIWSFDEERYSYAQVTALKEIKQERRNRTIFVIEVHDAHEWSTGVEVIFPGPEEKAFLSRRSGRKIEMLSEP